MNWQGDKKIVSSFEDSWSSLGREKNDKIKDFLRGGPRFLKIVLQDISPLVCQAQTSSVVAIHK
jgi:hypothetical protein